MTDAFQRKVNQMNSSTQTQNLNSKLSRSVRASVAPVRVGISWKATAIRSSAPPVRIVGSRSRYQGGYRVNV